MKKPRGTRDLYGQSIREFNYVCDNIKRFFSLFGYSEVKTPIFESVDVFAENDESFLSANKEFFYLQSKGNLSDKPEFVLRPENTASVVRMVNEDNLINEKNLKTLSYFYCGPYFRYERPQNGRFRQFTQAGVEKINAQSIDADVENIVLMKKIIDFFNLTNIKLKCNYLGCENSKKRWKEALTEYFRKFENELSEDSKKRIEVNPFRILDDKEDREKAFVKKAPSILDYLTEEEKMIRGFLEIKIGKVIGDSNFSMSNDIFRGIDYYDGLVFEWVHQEFNESKENSEITIAAGGRYDGLFNRFNKKNSYPSLGFAIGIERLCMVLHSEGKFPPLNSFDAYVCFANFDNVKKTIDEIKDSIFFRRIQNNPNFSCFISYENMSFEKHLAMASRMGKSFFFYHEDFRPEAKKAFKKNIFRDLSRKKNYKCYLFWNLLMSIYLMKNQKIKRFLLKTLDTFNF